MDFKVLSTSVNLYAVMICIIFGFIMYALNKAGRVNKFNWIELVTSLDQATGTIRASSTKVLQILGAVTSTFIVIKLTLENAITWDLFALYLVYVASVDGFSKFILAKYGVVNSTPFLQQKLDEKQKLEKRETRRDT